MYELKYVKKKTRNKFIVIGAGVSTIVVTTFAIIAFLGRFVGTFTVSLNTGDVSLALSTSQEFVEQSSFLRVDSLPDFQERTYSQLPDADALDSEHTSYLDWANKKSDNVTISSIPFFKYTFFVKNVGGVPAGYTMKIRILDSKAANDGRKIEDTLRVMLYDNDGSSTEHNKEIYAKRSPNHHLDEDGNVSFAEAITVDPSRADEFTPFLGYAKEFESDSIITTISTEEPFETGDIKRYTLVTWLEGFDLQSDNFKKAPKGANLRLGVEINAYEY